MGHTRMHVSWWDELRNVPHNPHTVDQSQSESKMFEIFILASAFKKDIGS